MVWGGSPPPTPLLRVSPGVLLPHTDDNSNQSSIADASPIKQENGGNSSPAPEPSSSAPGDGSSATADEAQAEGKELPGAEGMCAGGGDRGPLSVQPSAPAGANRSLRRPCHMLAPGGHQQKGNAWVHVLRGTI